MSAPHTNWRNPLTGQHDVMRDGLWWYFCMPYGVWGCRDGKVVLFNRARRPILVNDPQEGLYRPRSCKLFDRSWAEWDGPTDEDDPEVREAPPYDVEYERRFYNNHDGPPWAGGHRAGETRVKIMLILCDFMDGKMPERGSKK